MMTDHTISNIAVVGGGIVGLSAATAFARALPRTRITVIDTAPDAAALADVLPTTWPRVARFHAAIGIDELDLVRSGIATHRLGTIFEDWSSSGAPWIHAFGSYGKPAGAIPFDHIWWSPRQSGEALAYDCYSVGAALARAGKFVHPATDPNSIGSRYQYGLRLDPGLYRDRILNHAMAAGATILRGKVAHIERAEAGIEALLLADKKRVEADLFIDCSGPSASLSSAVDDSFENWDQWMPFDRIVMHSHSGAEVPSPADRARGEKDGWTLEMPLKGRNLRANLRIGGEGIPIIRGRRLRPWVQNVFALGEAAVAMDPLHGLNLDVAQQMILLALENLPSRAFDPVETEEYNRRAEQLTRRVRDFLALHYLCSGRTSGLWEDLAGREPPDSLARTLDQYRYRGRLPFFEDESITRDDWTAALLGMGVTPTHADPQALAVPPNKAVTAMRELAHDIQQAVTGVPTYADYLASMMRQAGG